MKEQDWFALLAIAAFVLLASIPPFLFALYYLDVVELPALSAGAVSFGAIGILFAIAAFFVALAFLSVAARKKPKYAWEEVFPLPPEESYEEIALAREREFASAVQVKPVQGESAVAKSGLPLSRLLAAIGIVALLIVILVAAFNVGSVTERFFGNESGNKSNRTLVSVEVPKVEKAAVKNATLAMPDFRKMLGSAKGNASAVVASAKRTFEGIPYRAWTMVAAVAAVVLVIASLSYSYRTRQLQEVPAWVSDWYDWAGSGVAAARMNKRKVVLVLGALAAVAAVIAAFVFREKIKFSVPANIPSSVSSGAVDALVALRNFAFIYRLYIFIGIFALLVVLGILFLIERRSGRN